MKEFPHIWFENKEKKYKYRKKKPRIGKLENTFEKIDNTKIKTILLIASFTLLICGIFAFASSMNRVYEENSLLKIIMIADADLLEISIDAQRAESYYAEASYAYEYGDDKETERNCRLAREYYFKEGQGYKRVRAELKAKEIDAKLITLYLEQLDLLSEITNNMYEACEYLESAARYYDLDNYYMGGEEISMMNEKIKAHDDAVEKYNNLLAEYKAELKKLN